MSKYVKIGKVKGQMQPNRNHYMMARIIVEFYDNSGKMILVLDTMDDCSTLVDRKQFTSIDELCIWIELNCAHDDYFILNVNTNVRKEIVQKLGNCYDIVLADNCG